MVQPKYSPEEALERVKLMMSYDMGKTLNENREIIFEQGKAIRNKGVGLGRLESLLSNLNPTKLSKLPIKSSVLGTQNIENIQVKTNIGDLYFFKYKPGGYFTQNNFVLVVKDGVTTIGTWDLDNMYFKKQGDTSFRDSGFDTTIRLSDLKPQQDTKVDGKKDGKAAQQGGGYRDDCAGSYSFGCKTSPQGAIGLVQACIGVVVDGKFGPNTRKALNNKGYTSFTDAEVNKICNKTTEEEPEISGEAQSISGNSDF
jgi:hypothetical protein